ncbi:16702_t:CDS:2 [Cetraspora pellucida]|uniref:16702_t:CDS:1 n=1 Tax=Cetraspora pellucida TaxID=1433469 RepID=A0ACA9KMH8_9GLOM|nr:16702_t:CDS:2 [Cetraspora pellucida]
MRKELDQEKEKIGEETEEETKKKTEEKTEKKADNSINRPNITKIVNLVKNTLYDALCNYFDSLPNLVLFASILDPRFKKMKEWLEEEKERVITLLRSEYTLFKDEELLNNSYEFNNKNRYHLKERKEKTNNNFKLHLFEEEEEIINEDEINFYLDRFRTPQANGDSVVTTTTPQAK